MYRKLKPSRSGPPREVVRRDQLARIRRAMIEVTVANGYESASIVRVSALAGVSRRTFYDLFPQGKSACFLDVYDHIVEDAISLVASAWADELDSRDGLRCAFERLVAAIVEQPGAARFALVDARSAGEAGRQRMERTREVFERMVGASFANAPDAEALPRPIVSGVVRAIERLVRHRLIAGREEELPGLADELLAWVLSHETTGALCLGDGGGRAYASQAVSARPGAIRSRDERVQMLRVTAKLVAQHGYEGLTHAMIAKELDMGEERVRELCGEPEDCFLGALELLCLEALIVAARASRGGDARDRGGADGRRAAPARSGEDRLVGVVNGIAALLEHVSADRVLCRVAFVEVHAVGQRVIERREALLGKFTDLLVRTLPAEQRPADTVAELITGAIWGVLRDRVRSGGAAELPALAEHCAYMALAPQLGGAEALRVVLAARPSC